MSNRLLSTSSNGSSDGVDFITFDSSSPLSCGKSGTFEKPGSEKHRSTLCYIGSSDESDDDESENDSDWDEVDEGAARLHDIPDELKVTLL